MSANLPVYQVGDSFILSTRRIYTTGKIVKINRVNLVYESVYQPSPTMKPIISQLTLPRAEMAHARIFRSGAGVIQEPAG